jgi:hypothetical protein
MPYRLTVMLFAFAVAACSPAEARQDAQGARAAQVDHQRCLRNGFRPGSSKYDACRKQLARRRAPEPERRQARERSWWPFPNAIDYVCEVRGYRPGTAAYEDCRRQEEFAAGQRRLQEQQEEQQKSCLRGGTGIVTPLGGSSFSVFCPGRTFICPGDINCPICPGSIGCPPK